MAALQRGNRNQKKSRLTWPHSTVETEKQKKAALHGRTPKRGRETKESGRTWPHSKEKPRNKRKRPYMAALQSEDEKQKKAALHGRTPKRNRETKVALHGRTPKRRPETKKAALHGRSPNPKQTGQFSESALSLWLLQNTDDVGVGARGGFSSCTRNRLQHAKKVSSAARSLWHGSSFGRGPIADCSRATGGRVPKCPKMSQVSKDRFLLPRSRSARGIYKDLPSRSARGTYNDLVSRSARGTYLALHQFAPFCTQNVWKLSSGRRSRFRFIALRAGSAQRKVTERNAMK